MKKYMSRKVHAYFTYIFIGLVVLDILVSSFGYTDFRVISKPLILLSLLVYFIFSGKHLKKTTYILTILALFCSLLGDVFLLFETQGSLFFPLGLTAFLIAHLLYTFIFIKKRNKIPSSNFWWIALFLFSYGALLFYNLKDSLGALKIPVILYILGILAMALSAYRRKGNVAQVSFNYVFAGALFFVLSDSVLALDKFTIAIPQSHIIIMGTYAIAQYLITKGILRQVDF